MHSKKIIFAGIFVAWLMPGLAHAEDFWLKDPDTGCQIWNDEAPTADDVVSWSGECTDGKAAGRGVLVWMKGDKLHGRYDGGMAGGKLDGRGAITLRAEEGEGYDRMRGIFKDGEAEGRAIYVGANGDYYEGHVRRSEMHGRGVYSDAMGNSYEGRFVNGIPDGSGYAVAATGEEYLGEFVEGERHGTAYRRSVLLLAMHPNLVWFEFII